MMMVQYVILLEQIIIIFFKRIEGVATRIKRSSLTRYRS